MKKVNNNLVQGDGFKIEIPNLHQLLYHEGDKTLELSLFDTRTASGYITKIPFSKPRWDFVNLLNGEEKLRIMSRISKALDLLKVKHEFDTNASPGF